MANSRPDKQCPVLNMIIENFGEITRMIRQCPVHITGWFRSAPGIDHIVAEFGA